MTTPSLSQLIELILSQLPDPALAPDPITEDTALAEGLAMDSFTLLKLVVSIEDTFEICLEEGDGESLATVGDLLSLIRRRVGAP